MTNPTFQILLAFLAGTAIGGFFFGGLWWTVRRIATSERPACLTLASFVVRTALAVTAFYFVMGGHWERIASALLGVLLVRILMVRHLRPQPAWKRDV